MKFPWASIWRFFFVQASLGDVFDGLSLPAALEFESGFQVNEERQTFSLGIARLKNVMVILAQDKTLTKLSPRIVMSCDKVVACRTI